MAENERTGEAPAPGGVADPLAPKGDKAEVAALVERLTAAVDECVSALTEGELKPAYGMDDGPHVRAAGRVMATVLLTKAFELLESTIGSEAAVEACVGMSLAIRPSSLAAKVLRQAAAGGGGE